MQSEFADKYEMTEYNQPMDSNHNVQPNTLKETDESFQEPEEKKFWHSLHEWADATSLHGIRFVSDSTSPTFRRAVWFVIMVVLFVYLAWNGQSQVKRYLKYSTLTVQTSKVHEKLPFPSVSICKSDFIRNNFVTNETERQLLKTLLQTTPNESLLTDYEESFLRSLKISDLIPVHVIKLDDFILDCSWGGVTINCSKYFESSLAESGLCFTVKKGMLETMMPGEEHGLQVKLWYGQDTTIGADDDSYGIKVLVHGATEEPIMESSSLVGPGFAYNIPVTVNENSYQPYPAVAFGTQFCKHTEDDSTEQYTLAGCFRHCRQDFFLNHCGCVSYLDNQNDIQMECSAYEMINCYHKTLVLFMGQMDNCHCAIPCHVTKYQTIVSSTSIPKSSYNAIEEKLQTNENIEILKENIVILKVFHESMVVTYTDQIRDFTFEDIWASFGGYLSLFAGASVFTFIEVFDILACIVYRNCTRTRPVE